MLDAWRLGGTEAQRMRGKRGGETRIQTQLSRSIFYPLGGLNLEILNLEIDPKAIQNLSKIDRSGVILGAFLVYF